MVIWIYLLTAVTHSFVFSSQPEKRINWYKGNLHTHSYWSDGDEFPEMIMDWYKANGYHFVALSDHNILAVGEKWIKVPRSRIHEDAFSRYAQKFGPEWVVSKTDSGRTVVRLKTHAEYRTLFEDERFLIIPSEEITDNFEGKPIHLNATNVGSLIAPQHGGSVLEVLQNNVNAVIAQRHATGIPMFVHVNHPNFHYAITVEDLIGLRSERFFEVYNGHPSVHNYGDSTHPGTEEMWDQVNVAYSHQGLPLMYGLATDDSHNYHSFGSSFSNAGRGWVMVHADSLSAASIISAMERGDFYASTGVKLRDISVSNRAFRLAVDPVSGVSYTIDFIGAKKGDHAASVLLSVAADEATYHIPADVLFVRARVVSNKFKENPFQAGDFEMAWTQPVAVRE